MGSIHFKGGGDSILYDATGRLAEWNDGIDLTHSVDGGLSARELLVNGTMRANWPKPEPGQIDALILDIQSANNSRLRVRARL